MKMQIELKWERTEHTDGEARARAAEAQRIQDSPVFKDAVRIATEVLVADMMTGTSEEEVMGARYALHGLASIQMGLGAIIGDGAVAEEREVPDGQ